jgi:hypothetical protein
LALWWRNEVVWVYSSNNVVETGEREREREREQDGNSKVVGPTNAGSDSKLWMVYL